MNRTGNERTGNQLMVIPVAAATVLTENTIAAVNDAGYAVPGAKAEGLTCAGRVQKLADNSAGEAGAVTVEVKRGVFVWDNDGTIEATDLLKTCYMAGPQSVTITATGASPAGVILAVDEDGVTVEMFNAVAGD